MCVHVCVHVYMHACITELIVSLLCCIARPEDRCFICLDEDLEEDLIFPCQCRGELGVVHPSCLQKLVSIIKYLALCVTVKHYNTVCYNTVII